MDPCDECESLQITLEGSLICPVCDNLDDATVEALIGRLTGSEARSVLRSLGRRDEELATELVREAIGHLADEDANVQKIADRIVSALAAIPVEEVWDRAGETRRGKYVEPGEAAANLASEELQPYEETMERYLELSMQREAKAYCKGLLKGLYQFEEESTSEFSDWASDVPRIKFNRIRNNWAEACDDPEDVEEIAVFVEEVAPEWASATNP
ncbi:MAG: hypothetical protein ABEH56_07400 [Salinirussus sp.]